MRKIGYSLFTFFVLLLLFVVGNAQTPFFFRAQSSYSIVLPQTPTEVETYAASQLQYYITKCSGAVLPIISELEAKNDSLNVFIGKTFFSIKNLSKIKQIENDGFIIYSDKKNLFIYGSQGKSTLYGVYDFLENYLDFRLYTPDALVFQQKAGYHLPEIDKVENPSFAYREVLYYYPNHSQLYADWHKLQNRADLNKEWGMFVHTFCHLIPVEQYFETHPEWFSEIHGKRIKDGQLCLSNPEVLEELCKNLRKKIDENPEAKYWSVSNNDNMNNCQCAKCHRLDSLYGCPSGTLLYFINQVASRFPDKIISTLGYQYTRNAPQRLISPADNVNIMLCSIECGREQSIATSPHEESFRSDMYGWKRITDNIFLWDYVVQFRSMMNPFPNLHVLQPNLKYFHDKGVKMMFEQGTGADNKTSWMEIRNYLIAKLLWNVDVNQDAIMNDFCEGYYEAAAPFIREYFISMHQSLLKSGKRLDIYGYPISGKDGYLSPTQIKTYQDLISRAYQSVGNNQILRNRIRYLELSLDFAVLELSMSEVSSDLSFFKIENGKKVVRQDMMKRAEQFVADCDFFGVENLEEMGYSPEKFKTNIDNFIAKSLIPNLAYHKKVSGENNFSTKYDAGGLQALTDGIVGIQNYNYNWLGFEGENMDIYVDLEKETLINEIGMDFYFFPLSWIFAPKEVVFYISNDAKKWKKVGRLTYENPQVIGKAHLQNYSVTQIEKKARYVRVVAKSLLTNPEWHRGFGLPCWIFTDELIVK